MEMTKSEKYDKIKSHVLLIEDLIQNEMELAQIDLDKIMELKCDGFEKIQEIIRARK